jgi:hypothetical protein
MASKKISELDLSTALIGDELIVNVQGGVTKHTTLDTLKTYMDNNIIPPVQGHYALLSNFYFDGGLATETVIEEGDTNQWLDLVMVIDPEGTFDYRPDTMVNAQPIGHSGTGAEGDPICFKLEGLTQSSSANLRSVFSFDPDEDNSRLEIRLLFTRHSGTTPNTPFAIEESSILMETGADEEYAATPNTQFFIGDTIDTNGPGDAGQVQVQIRVDTSGTLSVKEMVLFIQS